MKFAKRMDMFQESIFTTLKDKKTEYTKKTGKDPIDFSIGSPNIYPEPSIIKVMQESVTVGDNYRYAIKELPEMIEAIQDWYKNRYHVELAYDEIMCLQGSQEALSTLPLAVCDPGDIVLVPDPHYPIFSDGPKIAGAEVVYMPMKEEYDYLIQFDQIDEDVAKKAKMMIVSYPNNPTCATAPDSFYEKLIAFAKKYDILVVHDNAYSELVFDGKIGKSFLSYPGAKEVGVELNSFSKTYGMAGARLGVLVGNEEVVRTYNILKSNMDYGIFLPVQYAGIEALRHGGSSIPETRQAYQDRRDALVKAFAEAGWDIPVSKATMFAWARIPDTYKDSAAFVLDLLDKAGVVVTPGQSFGEAGERYVRLALVQDIDQIEEAARRIKKSGIFRR
ncbi:aminotransferase class I/II-fold pyridoxal phosphate-dependent enzyme [Catenisphaera adipataccumulans]|uniref:Aminotransferase n=1 Tax=Catenisphaera adipataccumulans TaxID=700500 RepID=A0A7W8FV79_9FIRM|nr:aminotransferase class I/II-fold pyridoxal phosphate-dependent enzyme [Catenisphaera adipataccumulans]MBB5183354.1 LL-diaminopimelate aminotransferase [Catenisphaera adipataccumulans]